MSKLKLGQMVLKYRGTTQYRYQAIKESKYRLTIGCFIGTLFLDTGAYSSIECSVQQRI